MNTVTRKDIAFRLGIVTRTKKPHVPLIEAVLSELDVRPLNRSRTRAEFEESSIQQVRQWFYERVGIEFPEFIEANSQRFQVRYLPEEDAS
ncbi:hypothetical protein DFP93_101266 [Aneurinibacillus soli]|uniref:Uncharacterized protein n=1 Tax=Aneurinibacillus soli TaxID=1500254 RepID=A0A0U5BBU4_9BACL|nr:hypothetical protein [Aneurinibacillus soli]PYE64240.1 hypothetical protein DFP93_101266 [Aneurinibacillus soli]BAU28189.1 hypothetical protein CB4_02363 [Aneurinibacillus soli]